MKLVWGSLVVVAGLGILAGCGVPREAGRLAAAESGVLAQVPADDAGVRRELAGQVAAWERLVGLLDQREFGGVAVGEDFVALVREAAALAGGQKELMDGEEDEAALNRGAREEGWGDCVWRGDLGGGGGGEGCEGRGGGPAAVARGKKALMDGGEVEAAWSMEAMGKLRGVWGKGGKYLGG